MMGIHNNWRKFLTEGKFVTADDKLLREVTEDEMDHIARALDEMKPEDLAFNKVFKEKNRVLIDFPTSDESSELGRFVSFFQKAGYDVDWNKGILSGEIVIHNSSPDAVISGLLGMGSLPGPGVDRQEQTKKIQMKIGKFFVKLKKDIIKFKILRTKVRRSPREVGANPRYWTGNDIKSALDEDELSNYYRLYDQIEAYVKHIEFFRDKFINSPEEIDKMAQYWQQNADFIKKSLDTLVEDKYAILITRHPVDILRMSDFDDINSCHSPPSREQADGTHYKCAVAEAHGHGAIAYVVNKSDLQEEFGTRNIRAIEESSAFQQNQDFFYDDVRDVGAEVEPVSRLRLRQVRYWNDVKGKDVERVTGVKMPGTQLAVPEQRVYGVKVPGFRDKVMEWAVDNQKEQLTNAPKENNLGLDAISLDNFVKFGGSYEDNFIIPLTKDLFKNFDELYASDARFLGGIKQDRTTEKDLDKKIHFNAAEQLEGQVTEFLRTQHFWYFNVVPVNFDVEHGMAYVVPKVTLSIPWPEEEWKSMPSNLNWLIDEFGEFGEEYEIFEKHGRQVWAERTGADLTSEIHLHMKVNLPSFNEGRVGFNFDEFEELLEDLHDKEHGDWLKVVKHIATRSLRRENILQGGQFDHITHEVDNKDFDGGDWDVETAGEGKISDYEFVVASMPTEVSFAELGIDLKTAKTIVSSKEFMINLRTEFISRVREKFDDLRQKAIAPPETDLFVDEALEGDDVIMFKITFSVDENDKDNMADLWRKIIETTPDGETADKLSQKVFNMYASDFASAAEETEEPTLQEHRRIKLKNRSAEQRMHDKWRRFLR